MTDEKITDLTALTGANLASNDVFEVSDISDTTMDASGTSKKMTARELAAGMAALGGLLATKTLAGSQSWTQSIGSPRALDTTNLALTFIVPPSGNVLLRANGFRVAMSGANNPTFYWMTSSTVTVVGWYGSDALNSGNALGVYPMATLLTGQTAGSSLTLYLGAAFGATVTVRTGEQCLLSAWAA